VTIGLHVSDQGSMAERRRSSRLISPKTPSRWASCWPTSRCGARYTATLARGIRPSAASGIGSHKVCGIRRRRPRVGSIPKGEPVNPRDASVSSPTGSESNRPQPSISSLPRWSVTVPHGAKRRCRPSRLRRLRMCMFFLRSSGVKCLGPRFALGRTTTIRLPGSNRIPRSITAVNSHPRPRLSGCARREIGWSETAPTPSPRSAAMRRVS
jgi:hypothetical protein